MLMIQADFALKLRIHNIDADHIFFVKVIP